jgi:hypothetical protein
MPSAMTCFFDRSNKEEQKGMGGMGSIGGPVIGAGLLGSILGWQR